ncbi:hypothetical protein D3C85_1872860 [compost metagenome]
MDDFASGAAMVAHSPEMAAQATGAMPSPSLPPQGGMQPGGYTGPMANPPQQPAISQIFSRPQGGMDDPAAQQQMRRF